MTDETINVVVTDFYDDSGGTQCVCCDHSKGFGHRPYRGLLHESRGDREVAPDELVRRLIARSGAADGDEIEISVRKTGKRPYGDRRFVWTEPHTYAREARAQQTEASGK